MVHAPVGRPAGRAKRVQRKRATTFPAAPGMSARTPDSPSDDRRSSFCAAWCEGITRTVGPAAQQPRRSQGQLHNLRHQRRAISWRGMGGRVSPALAVFQRHFEVPMPRKELAEPAGGVRTDVRATRVLGIAARLQSRGTMVWATRERGRSFHELLPERWPVLAHEHRAHALSSVVRKCSALGRDSRPLSALPLQVPGRLGLRGVFARRWPAGQCAGRRTQATSSIR